MRFQLISETIHNYGIFVSVSPLNTTKLSVDIASQLTGIIMAIVSQECIMSLEISDIFIHVF